MEKEEIKNICKALKLSSGSTVFWCYPDSDIIVNQAISLSYVAAAANAEVAKKLKEDLDKAIKEGADKGKLAITITALEIIGLIDTKTEEILKVKTNEESKLQISLGRSLSDLKELKEAIKAKYKVN